MCDHRYLDKKHSNLTYGCKRCGIRLQYTSILSFNAVVYSDINHRSYIKFWCINKRSYFGESITDTTGGTFTPGL